MEATLTFGQHLDHLSRRISDVDAETARVTIGLPEPLLQWRPQPGVWAISQCLDHLAVSARAFEPYVTGAIEKARARGPRPDGHYRPTWLGRFMIRTLGPEAGIKLPVPKVFAPGPVPLPGSVERFEKSQRDLEAWMARAEGLDLNVTLRSPATPLVRYSLGDTFALLVAHAQRHLAQARRVRERDDFPSG